MTLDELLAPFGAAKTMDCVIQGIQNDSRQVKPKDLFLAYPGAAADGRLFIANAVAKGAAAVAYDPHHVPLSVVLPTTIPCIPIPRLAEVLGKIAQSFYSDPSKDLYVTGVTGTNGKTTIAYQLAQAYRILGQKSAYIGTIGQGEVHDLKPLENTTPDGLFLQKMLSQYKQQAITQVCMEVSSHALSQHRVDGVHFKQAIFTNLTLEHLDYHHTMKEYARAKARLFRAPELEYALLNGDDPYYQDMQEGILPHVTTLTYGIKNQCDVQAIRWQTSIEGTEIEVQSPWGSHELKIKSLGQFNIYNSLAIFSSLIAHGYEPKAIIPVLLQVQPAPGRMELVEQSPYVLVDYAHTPDALDNALATLKELKKGRLWVVFGCGGDRDKSKRPLMGQVAVLHADHIVITSDNPRTEVPENIIEEIAEGALGNKPITKLVNREEAIAFALNQADQDDIILIAGKGHEAYQQIGLVKHHFSDQEVVRRLKNK